MSTLIPMFVIGDGVATTGFSRVIHSILRNLPQGYYDIHHLATNYYGDPHEEKWKIYPATSKGQKYGLNRVKELIEKINPRIVFSINDLWYQREYLKILKEYAAKTKIVFYSPVESTPVDPEWVEDFTFLTRCVVYTQFAKNELLKALKLADFPIEVIPHGVAMETFFPYPDRTDSQEKVVETGLQMAKRQLKLFNNEDCEGSFVVLNSNRNQPRKRIDLTIKGFAAFAKDNKPPNVKLYLNMGIEDCGWNILKLSERYGISDRIIITYNENTLLV